MAAAGTSFGFIDIQVRSAFVFVIISIRALATRQNPVLVRQQPFRESAGHRVQDARASRRIPQAEVVAMQQILSCDVVKRYRSQLGSCFSARQHPADDEVDHYTADVTQKLGDTH